MKTALITSEWREQDGVNVPQIKQDYPLIASSDYTGNYPPVANLSVWGVVVDTANASLILANNDYSVETTDELGNPAFLDIDPNTENWQEVLNEWLNQTSE